MKVFRSHQRLCLSSLTKANQMLPDVGIDGAVYDSVLHRVAGLRWLQCVVHITYHYNSFSTVQSYSLSLPLAKWYLATTVLSPCMV